MFLFLQVRLLHATIQRVREQQNTNVEAHHQYTTMYVGTIRVTIYFLRGKLAVTAKACELCCCSQIVV